MEIAICPITHSDIKPLRKYFTMFKINQEQEDGFTLIELLVVILIIGVLASIAIPAFLNQRKSAVDASLKSDVKQLATIAATWQVKNPNEEVPSFALREPDTEVPAGSHNTAGLPYKPTPGNYIKMFRMGEGDDKGYCISAWSPGSSQYVDENTSLQLSSHKAVIGVRCFTN